MAMFVSSSLPYIVHSSFFLSSTLHLLHASHVKMGIKDLLKGLKSYSVKGNVREFANQSVAVDASSWLHKSVYSIADHYVESMERGGPVDRRSVSTSSSYIEKRCQELLTYAHVAKIYLVMDGKRCPLKAVTNEERERRRQENLVEARKYKRQHQKDKMFEKYKTCIKVRADLAEEVAKLIEKRFDRNKVEIVWSPYEADAQLVKLCIDKLTQAVITEDSDVLVYSMACRTSFPILFKVDRNNGSCDILSMDRIISQQQSADNPKSSGIDQYMQLFVARELRDHGLGVRLFVQACVLAGCDYSPNELSGVGLVSAFKYVRSAIHRSSEDRFRHVLNMLPVKARKSVNKIEYEEGLSKSEAVFYYHPVRNLDGKVVYLADPSEESFHRPSLSRFGGDCLFLGDVGGDVTRKENLQSGFRKNGMNSATEALVGTEPKDFPAKIIPNFVGISNPYSKKRKRTGEEKSLSKGRKKTAGDGPSRVNPFDKFAHKEKENRVSGQLVRYLQVRDVRFVKRNFKEFERPRMHNNPVSL